jgi:iron(II)-dependent oxidoreductase
MIVMKALLTIVYSRACLQACIALLGVVLLGCRSTDNEESDSDAGVDAEAGTDAGADGSVSLTWVSVPQSTFVMGKDEGELDERPEHSVVISAFDISRTEVTIAQYRECVEAEACLPPDTTTEDNCNWSYDDRLDHPVDCVDWDQASAFCLWAGGRLPSEAEWEYSARNAGEEFDYPWGDSPSWPNCTVVVMSEVELGGSGCGEHRTWPVCSKTAGNTDLGLCDMSGNVWEWVQDWYHDNYEDAPDDGSAWEMPEGTRRVLRGCSFVGTAVDELNCFRTTARNGQPPELHQRGYGFRCAR